MLTIGGIHTGNFPAPQDHLAGTFPLRRKVILGQYPVMTKSRKSQKNPKAAIVANNLTVVLRELGKRDQEASTEAGFSKSFIRDIRRGSMPSAANLARLAESLGTTSEALMTRTFAPPPKEPATSSNHAITGIPYIGEVAAGNWLEIPFSTDHKRTIPVLDPRFPPAAQYVLGVRGNSINLIADDGAYLICVDIGKAEVAVGNGDLVVVQREDAGRFEVTAKFFQRRSSKLVEFLPSSTDPRWQPIPVPADEEDQETHIKTIAKVTGVYTPVRAASS